MLERLRDITLERTLLNSLMMEDGALLVVGDLVEAHYFSEEAHSLIYGVIKNLDDRGLQITGEMVHVEVAKLNRDALYVLKEVQAHTPQADYEKLADDLIEYHRKRELFKISMKIQAQLADMNSGYVVKEVEKELTLLDVAAVTRGRTYAERKEEIDKLPPLAKYETGVKFVDDSLTGGINLGQLILVMGDPEAGKAQPLDAKIYTPDGYKLMGEIQKGDKVIGSNGKAVEVMGVYPQGYKDAYEVIFDDGSKTVCCDEHLWAVKTRKDRQLGRDARVVTLREIIDDEHMIMQEGKYTRCKYSVDVTEPVEFTFKDVPLHPYLLGYLIGNGSITHKVGFSTADKEVVEKLSSLLPLGYKINQRSEYDYSIVKTERNNSINAVWQILIHLKLAGKGSWEKFIPKEYLYGSIYQREQLLHGLMDSDGHVAKNKAYYEYTTVSKTLADDFLELVRSFGARARVVKKKTKHTHNDIEKCSFAYRVTFSLKNSKITPVWLERKRADIQSRQRELHKFIREIRYVGRQDMQCISVAAKDRLYLTDDFTITHNTILTTQILRNISKGFLTLFFCFEFTVRQFVDVNEKRKKEWNPQNLILIDDGYALADVEREIKVWAKRGCKFVVIDSQMRVDNSQNNGTVEQMESEKFSKLAKLCHRLEITILLISQQGKEDTKGGVHTPMGSKKGGHEASQIWYLHKLKPKYDEDGNDEHKEKRLFEISKNKQNGRHFKTEVSLNPVTLDFHAKYNKEPQETSYQMETKAKGKKEIPVVYETLEATII